MKYKYNVGDMFEVLEDFSSFLFKGEKFSIVETDEEMNYYHQLLIGRNAHMSVDDDIISHWINQGFVKMVKDKIYKVNKSFNIGYFFATEGDTLRLKSQTEKYYVFFHVSMKMTSFKEIKIERDNFDLMLEINPSILSLEEKLDTIKEGDVFFAQRDFSLSDYSLSRNTRIKIIECKNAEKSLVLIENKDFIFLCLVRLSDLKCSLEQGELVRKLT